jgi:hypothetical protein
MGGNGQMLPDLEKFSAGNPKTGGKFRSWHGRSKLGPDSRSRGFGGPSQERKNLAMRKNDLLIPSLLAVALLAGLSPAQAARRSGPRARPAAPPTVSPTPSRPAGPSVIDIRPSRTPEEKARRERELDLYRGQVHGRLGAWQAAYREALPPVLHAVDEALRSLAISWGPVTKSSGYAIEVAVNRFVKGQALPAPESQLDAELRRAVSEISTGAAACTRGLPTTAQLHLLAGRRWLARAERTLASFAAAPRP